MNAPMSTKSIEPDKVLSDRLVLDLEIKKIVVPENRARHVNPAYVDALAGSIREQGLQYPIKVREQEGKPVLVSGRHRLEAFILNGEERIPALLSTAKNELEARLEEVTENLIRNEPKGLDRCQHLYEMKLAYEQLHPETKAGVAGAKARHGSANEIFSFAQKTAEVLGISKRSIEMAVSVWKGLSDKSRCRLVGTWLADHMANLKILSEQTAKQQEAILNLILATPPKASNVTEALMLLTNGCLPSAIERKFKALSTGLSKLKDDELDVVLTPQAERIVAWVKAKGLA